MDKAQIKSENAQTGSDSGTECCNNIGIRSPTDWLKLIVWIMGVVAVGLIVVNQFMGYYYKAQLLGGPCKLCGELNPEVQTCIDQLNSPRPSYWIAPGQWSDPYETKKEIEINITN